MNFLSFVLKQSRGMVALSVLAGMAGGMSGVGLIALIQAELSRETATARTLGLAFAGLCVVMTLTRAVANATMVRLAQGAVSRLWVHMGRALLDVPLARFEALDRAAVLAVLTEDVETVAGALVSIPMLCINATIVVSCFAFVVWLSPPLFAWGLAIAVAGLVGYEVFGTRGLIHLRRARAGQDELMGHFQSMIGGFRELKSHRGRRDVFLVDSLEATTTAVRDRNVSAATWFAAAGSWSLIAFFGFIGVLLYVLPSVQEISRPALAGSVLVVLYIMTPLEVILTWIPILGRARVSLLKIEALGLSLQAADEKPSAAPTGPLSFRTALDLCDVTYTYHHKNDVGRGEFTLGPIDLTLRPGEIVFLVGGNGSGKTTLVKLLAGLYSPESGSVRLDGRPITPENLETYRQLFSVVFTDGYLFPTLQGLDPAGLDRTARAFLARLELGDHVQVEGGAFSTTDLSQGQRKRLALLTAVLEDRPIMILDEWASNQDAHFKNVFYRELLPEWRARGKSILVITHDADDQHVADRVIHLESGRFLDRTGNSVASGDLDEWDRLQPLASS
jgi:putative ATP-binding cassette transporter